MTERSEIERLLNATGRTLEGLPEYYPEEQQEVLYREVIENFELWENRVLYQSDVIELLIGALRDALEKPKQKPLTLEEIKAGGALYIEFKDEDENEPEPVLISKYSLSSSFIGYERLGWVSRFNIDRNSYGRSWRCWSFRPTEEERGAAKWEN